MEGKRTSGVRIGLVLHPSRDPTPVAEKIVRWAQSHGSEVLVDVKDAERSPAGVRPVAAGQLAQDVDAVVSLGGDGTMLGALRLVAKRPVPVLGVNLGNVGFLAEVEPSEVDEALDRLENEDFTIEDHSAVVLSDGRDEVIAFNDVALASVPGEGQVHASVMVAGRAGGRYRCDALIIATPIGSTAYSYAAGGPVVSPALDAVIVTPVAPVSGIARSTIISATEPVQLMLLEGSGHPALEADGTVLRQMHPGDTLDMHLRPEAGRVVRLDAERYQRRSAVKLSLMDLPFLPHEMRDLAPGGDPVSLTADM
jgi:NAD+ kinase